MMLRSVGQGASELARASNMPRARRLRGDLKLACITCTVCTFLSPGQPSSGHYIANMVRNTSCITYHCWEFKFYATRQDSDGYWSWKQPAGPVFDTDIFGNPITDPEKQTMYGHYDIFCGCFKVFPDTRRLTMTMVERPMKTKPQAMKSATQESWHGLSRCRTTRECTPRGRCAGP